jgi:hypothetical protein
MSWRVTSGRYLAGKARKANNDRAMNWPLGHWRANSIENLKFVKLAVTALPRKELLYNPCFRGSAISSIDGHHLQYQKSIETPTKRI